MPNQGEHVPNKTMFDYTAMSTFLTCRRKYDFRINQGYVRSKDTQLAASFGGAIHHGLDSWYQDKDVARAVGVFKSEFVENTEIDDKRTHRMGQYILEKYDERYRDQPWVLVESEQTFNVPLPNGNRFIGRIDKVIKWNNCLWVVDHKTTSQLGATYFNMAEPNMQFVGYAWAMRQLGHDIKGVVVDAILVASGLLPGPKQNKNLTPFARYDTYYKQEHFDEWLQMVQSIQHDIRVCEDSEEWYPNFDACTDYVECPYRRVCKEEKALRQRVLDADYVIEPWDPLQREGQPKLPTAPAKTA